jgi:hypothetical protein
MQAEILAPESEDFRSEQSEITPNALAILNQSEHAAMVSTANLPSNRRKLKDFDDKLMAYANHSQPVALSMFYSLPRAGKQIIGASIRFAEIVAPCWKNCAVASRVVGDATDTVTAQGVFIDYECNLRNSIEVPRRITDKNGNRYNADMIVTTSNAAMSIARRNAVLKGGVPQALWSPAYEAAQLTAVGKAVSHAQRVADCMEYLNKLGVTELQALNAVECPSVKDLEIEHLVTLKVLCQEIKRGDKTIEQVFGSPLDKEIDALLTQLGKNATQQRMLKDSYAGRTKELLEYLTAQLRPQTQGTRVATPTQAAPTAEKVAKQDDPTPAQTTTTPAASTPVAGPKRGRGRPSKEEVARRKAVEETLAKESFVPPTTDVIQSGTPVADVIEQAGESDEGAAATQVAGSAFDLI